MVNPDWTGCTVRHLLLPTVQLLDEEVKAREAAYNRTVGHLDPLPTLERDIDVQSYAKVERAYEDVKAEREKARRPSVVTAWQEWVMGKELLLPDQERTYRRAIHAHEQALTKIENCSVVARLENHRDHVEKVKSVIKRIIHENRDLASTIIPSCSKAIQSTTKFTYAGPFESDAEKESLLEYFRPASYSCIASEPERPARVVFGTESTPAFVVKVLRELQEREGVVNISPWDVGVVKRVAFELEQKCVGGSVEDMIASESLENLTRYVVFGLLSSPPLIPLSNDDIRRLSVRLPRDELALRINAQSPHTSTILALVFNLASGHLPDLNTAPLLVAHRANAATIVSRIYASWDFENNRPLPPEMERRWDSQYGPHLWNITTNTFITGDG